MTLWTVASGTEICLDEFSPTNERAEDDRLVFGGGTALSAVKIYM